MSVTEFKEGMLYMMSFKCAVGQQLMISRRDVVINELSKGSALQFYNHNIELELTSENIDLEATYRILPYLEDGMRVKIENEHSFFFAGYEFRSSSEVLARFERLDLENPMDEDCVYLDIQHFDRYRVENEMMGWRAGIKAGDSFSVEAGSYNYMLTMTRYHAMLGDDLYVIDVDGDTVCCYSNGRILELPKKVVMVLIKEPCKALNYPECLKKSQTYSFKIKGRRYDNLTFMGYNECRLIFVDVRGEEHFFWAEKSDRLRVVEPNPPSKGMYCPTCVEIKRRKNAVFFCDQCGTKLVERK